MGNIAVCDLAVINLETCVEKAICCMEPSGLSASLVIHAPLNPRLIKDCS